MTNISRLAAVSSPVPGMNIGIGRWLGLAMKTGMVSTSIFAAMDAQADAVPEALVRAYQNAERARQRATNENVPQVLKVDAHSIQRASPNHTRLTAANKHLQITTCSDAETRSFEGRTRVISQHNKSIAAEPSRHAWMPPT